VRHVALASQMLGEGRMQDVNNVLGWNLYSWRLMVSLSDENHDLWSTEIGHHLENGSLLTKELETLVGRLEHVGYLIPLMRHLEGDCVD
jgi:hypothetical protein